MHDIHRSWRRPIDRRQLLYFLSTARHQHMGNAAAELGISESTLSRSIARFEREHGVVFFERVGRGLRLNAFGRTMQASVERAFAVLESAEREISATARSGSTRIALGFLPSLGARSVPQLLRRCKERDPQLEFRLVQGSAQTLRSALVDGELDLTLGTKRFEDAAVDWRPLWDEGLAALLPARHHAAKTHAIDFAEIAAEPLLTFAASETTRLALTAAGRLSGIAPTVVFSCNDISTLTGLVAAGFGVAVVPENLYVPRRGVACVRLPAMPSRTIGIGSARSRALSASARRFRDALAQESHG